MEVIAYLFVNVYYYLLTALIYIDKQLLIISPPGALKERLESDFGSSWPSGLCLSPIGLPESCFVSAVEAAGSVTLTDSTDTEPFSSYKQKRESCKV